MKRGIFVTIADIGRYYGKSPFEAGGIVKIRKDKERHGGISLRATLPLIGTVGKIATSPSKVAGGTVSGDAICGKIGRFTYAQIMFVSDFCVIAKVLMPKDVIKTPYLRAYRKKSGRYKNKKLKHLDV